MRVLAMALCVVLAACSRAPTASTPPEPPAATSPAPFTNEPTAKTPRGFVIRLEIASNDETRARGLMFRDRLEDDRGMLFIFPQKGVYPFWMKNTLIALDMIWLDENGRIVRIRPHIPPCEAEPCPSYSPEKEALYVLELAGGRAQALGLQEGDVLTLAGTDSYRVN